MSGLDTREGLELTRRGFLKQSAGAGLLLGEQKHLAIRREQGGAAVSGDDGRGVGEREGQGHVPTRRGKPVPAPSEPRGSRVSFLLRPGVRIARPARAVPGR